MRGDKSHSSVTQRQGWTILFHWILIENNLVRNETGTAFLHKATWVQHKTWQYLLWRHVNILLHSYKQQQQHKKGKKKDKEYIILNIAPS